MHQPRTPQQPRIGFYDSHHMPSGLSVWISEFMEAGIPIENSDCLCEDRQHYLEHDSLPPIAVVHPSYELRPCPEAIRGIVQAQRNTQFYVPVLSILTYDNSTIDRIMDAIGELPNVDFLCNGTSRPKSSNWKDYEETLHRLFEELRAPAPQ